MLCCRFAEKFIIPQNCSGACEPSPIDTLHSLLTPLSGLNNPHASPYIQTSTILNN